MGIAAAQFFSANNVEKQTLVRRISPTSQQMEDQQERWDALAEQLRAQLAKNTGHPIRHWLQGSYKFRTQIRPVNPREEFDIDLGIYCIWPGKPEEGDYSAADLKDEVRHCLEQFAEDNLDDVIEVTSPKPRCERIRFKGNFHIDVPAYHLDADRDARSLATSSDMWEISDPKALYLWFKNSFDDAIRAKARRHIRYFKCWAALRFGQSAGRPSSILLTILVAEAIKDITESDLAADDEAFSFIAQKILARLEKNYRVPNPVNRDEDLAARLSKNEFELFVSALRALKVICERALKSSGLISASDIWSEAFEHFFPIPEPEELKEEVLQKSTSRAVATLTFNPIIAVKAVAKKNANAIFRGVDEIGPIPKDCNIEFSLSNAISLPLGAQVGWVVRNEGLEAENKNDLGHRTGTGFIAQESSAYNGVHYMDCTVKLNGQIIGFKRVPVTISGVAVPPRNPRSRPSYVRLR